jgi:L-aminopeptidase/D-esterase-like protein
MVKRLRAQATQIDHARLPGGVRIGHAHDAVGLTGCTVILFDSPAVSAAEVRGSAAATSNFSLLDPVYSSSRTDAILLTGGSTFGLSAVVGVQRFLEDRGQGFDVGVTSIPRVPAAAIFDLGLGDYTSRPDHRMAMQACLEASDKPVEQGSVGVGMGATVGKFLGIEQAMRGGLGSASLASPYGAELFVLAVVNAFGDVWQQERPGILAGARKGPESRDFADTATLFRQGWRREGYGVARRIVPPPGEDSGDQSAGRGGGQADQQQGISPECTTLVVAITTARLDSFGLTKLASACHLGLSDVVRPSHTIYDGDLAIAVSMGNASEDLTTLCVLAQDLVAGAIVGGIKAATGAAEIPAWRDLKQD